MEVGNGEGMRWEGRCWDLELIGGRVALGGVEPKTH